MDLPNRNLIETVNLELGDFKAELSKTLHQGAFLKVMQKLAASQVAFLKIRAEVEKATEAARRATSADSFTVHGNAMSPQCREHGNGTSAVYLAHATDVMLKSGTTTCDSPMTSEFGGQYPIPLPSLLSSKVDHKLHTPASFDSVGATMKSAPSQQSGTCVPNASPLHQRSQSRASYVALLDQG